MSKTRQRSTGYVQNLGPVFEYRPIDKIAEVTNYLNNLGLNDRIIVSEIKKISRRHPPRIKYMLKTLANQGMVVRAIPGVHRSSESFYKKRNLTEKEVFEASQYRPGI